MTSSVDYFELKSLLDGRVEGWMEGKAGLRIAYSNQKLHIQKSWTFVSKLGTKSGQPICFGYELNTVNIENPN